MKANSFFGGSKLKVTGTHVRQVGTSGSSSGGGLDIQRKTTVKQVGTTHGTNNNNHMQHRDTNFGTAPLKRPNLTGKEDNRSKGIC